MNFSGKHVAITGASAGIGQAIARRVGRDGARVTLVARRQGELERLAAELEASGARCFIKVADMAVPEQMTAWVEEAEGALGPIDVAIANAGVQIVDAALSVSDEDAERQMAINTIAPLRLARRLGRDMAERGQGSLVIISSLVALTHTPGMADYAASKAAVSAWFETARVELAPRGVHVLSVYPGPVRTELERAAWDKLSASAWQRQVPTGEAEELADLIALAIDKRQDRLVYPKIYGVSRHVRSLSQWLTDRFAPRPKGLA